MMLQDNESGEIENELVKAKEENTEKNCLLRPKSLPTSMTRYRSGTCKKSVGSIGLQPLQTPAPPESGGQSGIIQINILLIGPTGSGKTLLAQSLARKLDVPLSWRMPNFDRSRLCW